MASYTVEQGDTLSGIARRLGMDLSALLDANPGIANPNKIKPGQSLKMPNMNPGTTSTVFDPNTPRMWDMPFQQFPTDSLAPSGTQLEQRLKPAQASPMAADPTATAKVDELTPAVQGARQRLLDMPGQVMAGLEEVDKRVKHVLSGDASPEEVVSLAMDAAMTTIGGGGAAGRVFRPPSRMPLRGPDPRDARPLPEGSRRVLAGPFFEPNSGTAGIYQKTRGTPTARARSNRHEESIDPLWWDAVVERVPSGQLKNTPDEIIPTRPLTTLGSNIIKPDFKAPRVPKDPKTNLERRMAKRTGSGEALPQSRWDQAQVDKYAREARKELSAEEFKALSPEGREAYMKDRPIAREIPGPTMSLKQQGQAERNKASAEAHKAKPLPKLMDIHTELSKGKLAPADAKASIEERIRQLQQGLLDGDLPDFP